MISHITGHNANCCELPELFLIYGIFVFFSGMVDQLDIFHYIREYGGTAKLIELKEKFYQIPDLERVLQAYNSLFWISKIKENYWEVRAKLDVEL